MRLGITTSLGYVDVVVISEDVDNNALGYAIVAELVAVGLLDAHKPAVGVTWRLNKLRGGKGLPTPVGPDLVPE
jgi:hypothetical protein